MLPGSTNALLKILEEPPGDSYFILLSSKREGIIPTLKSRLRQFQFYERDGQVQEEILRRIFRETSGEYGTLERYFLAYSANPEVIKKACNRFLKSIVEGSSDIFFTADDGEADYLKELNDPKVFRSLLLELNNEIRRKFLESDYALHASRDMKRLKLWNEALTEQVRRLESLNMNPSLLLHSLHREMAQRL